MPTVFANTQPLAISIVMLALFVALNFLNVRIGLIIQRCFFAAKAIPMISLIALGIYLSDIDLLTTSSLPAAGHFIAMLPLVLYCFSGFEAACSISRNMHDPEKNAPKAIFYSFFSIILLYVAFQTLVSMILLPNIDSLQSYTQAYPFIATLIPTSPWVQIKLATAISFLIGFSAMGAAYGLLFSNSWNLYTLAQHGHTFASKHLGQLGKHGVPTLAVLAEGVICLIFLLATTGNKIQLQQIATIGCTITYTISTIAFLYHKKWSSLTGLLSLLTCLGFIISCLASIMLYNFASLHLIGAMSIFGIMMYFCCPKKS